MQRNFIVRRILSVTRTLHSSGFSVTVPPRFSTIFLSPVGSYPVNMTKKFFFRVEEPPELLKVESSEALDETLDWKDNQYYRAFIIIIRPV